MKTISIINLKGGVAKTITAISMSHILATVHNKRVLLIDNDKQGNVSKMFGIHNYEHPTISELLTERDFDIYDVISQSIFTTLDIIPANMTLLYANKQILIDTERPQQTRLKTALEEIEDEYDYCIIDNAPDLNMSTINALVASDDVIVPVKIDNFALDGLAELSAQIKLIQKDFNPNLKLSGCLVTMYQNNDVNKQGKELLQERNTLRIFDTHIRRTPKVDESTFAHIPIVEYSRRSAPARDYLAFINEYLKVSKSDTKNRG